MRILHIVRTAGMLRAFMLPVMREQQRRGHYVGAMCVDDKHAEALRREGFDVLPHDLSQSFGPWNILGGALRTRKILRDCQIDAMIVHSAIAGIMGRLGAWLAGTKRVVYFAHGLMCAPAQGRAVWMVCLGIERLLGKLTDALLVMNDHDEELARRLNLVRKGTGKVLRITSMGVDVSKFHAGEHRSERESVISELGFEQADKVVICVARLVSLKGVHVYVDAAIQVVRKRPQTLFLLAGDGPESEHLMEKVQRAGMATNVRILGWRSDVHRLMQASDLFILPSYYPEGLPVSILEAMACGKPVISTLHRGCEDAVVDGETGFLVPIKDSNALARRMIELLDDDELAQRMGQAGRRRAEEHYELDRCTAEIMDALDEALGEPSGG